MIHHPARIASIRATRAGLLKTVTELDAKVGDPAFRERVQQVRDILDDVEGFFLAEIGRTPRTSAEESRWLSYTVMALTLAQLELHSVQDVSTKFGPGLRSIGEN